MKGRITLEPLGMEHLPEVTALWRRREVTRYTHVPEDCDGREAAERLEGLLACQAGLETAVLFAVCLEGRFCGIAGCPPVEPGRFGLFYQLVPEVWGRGVGKAVAAMAVESLLRCHPEAELLADVAAENTASVRILERLGFRRTAVHPGGFCRAGRTMDVWDFVRSPGGKEEEHT